MRLFIMGLWARGIVGVLAFCFSIGAVGETGTTREYVPLVNAQLNVKGMRGFAARALTRFTEPAPIWDAAPHRWRSINEMKYTADKWNDKEDAPKAAYVSCVALQQDYLKQGREYRIIADFNTPNGQALLDQQLQPIVYDVLLNATATAAIDDHQSGPFFFPGQIADSEAHPSVSPGAILIKFAWQIVAPPASSYSDDLFYQVKALLKLPNETSCHLVDLALLGFHIAMKPQQNTVIDGKLIFNSPFTWATYLHQGTVPTFPQLVNINPQDDNRWLLFNHDQPVTEPSILAACPDLQRYSSDCCQMLTHEQIAYCGTLTAQIMANEACVINGASPTEQPHSANLVQMCPSDAPTATPTVRAPWDQYQFIDIQWTSMIGKSIPATLSNPVLEPYFLQFKEPQTGNVSCVNCHQQADKTDTIFSIQSLLN